MPNSEILESLVNSKLTICHAQRQLAQVGQGELIKFFIDNILPSDNVIF